MVPAPPPLLNGAGGAASHLASLLDRCRSMREANQIYAQINLLGLREHSLVVSKLLLFCSVSEAGDVDFSYQVFRRLPNPSTFVWNTLIRGFSKAANPNRALTIYVQMLRSGVSPDNLTFPFLARACARLASLRAGAPLHCHVARGGLGGDRYVQNSLLHMYASCGDAASARRVFDEMAEPNLVSWNALVDGYAKCRDMRCAREMFDMMPKKDIISWSALMDGYVKCGDYTNALQVFDQMRAAGAEPNNVTMVSALCACAHLGALEQGRWMHRYAASHGLQLSLELATSMVDMYAKCGAVTEALAVFRSVPARKTDVLIWNAVIGGLAMHGLSEQSLELFREMRALGVKPDEITYLELLSACVHGGLVHDAWRFFRSLCADGMTPMVEHYACMVDVLGRSGRVEAAFDLVQAMPMEPSAAVLGALLSGCQTHARAALGEAVGKMLVELEPEHDGRYVGLSNVYAAGRRWEEARNMRRVMEKRGVKKAPGFSSVEVDGKLHAFVAHDKTHPHSAQVYVMLGLVVRQMKADEHRAKNLNNIL